jgi:hypothetical protein
LFFRSLLDLLFLSFSLHSFFLSFFIGFPFISLCFSFYCSFFTPFSFSFHPSFVLYLLLLCICSISLSYFRYLSFLPTFIQINIPVYTLHTYSTNQSTSYIV